MTDLEKINQMKAITGETDDQVITAYLRLAESKIVEKCYPFNNLSEPLPMPEKYDQKQIELATILYFKRGAEGEKSHNENGVNRTYEGIDEILKGVTPHVKVVG